MLSNIKINRKFWINFIFFAAGGFLLLYLYTKYRVAPDLPFANLALKTPEGQVVNLSQYKGKVIVLNFWETWCGPCVQEMPTFEKARMQTDSTQVEFIAIGEESAEKIAGFRDRNNYHFNFLISGKSFAELGINTYPTTYILNKEGEVVLTKIGGDDWASEGNLNLIKQLCK